MDQSPVALPLATDTYLALLREKAVAFERLVRSADPAPRWSPAAVGAAELYQPGTNTDYRRIPGRGHSLVFDSGWREVADVVLDWVGQHETSPAR